MTKTTDEEMLAIQFSYEELTNKFLLKGTNPFACAAAMTKLALMIYKTTLSDEEYNLMVDSISDSRDRIRSITDFGVSTNNRLN